MKKVLIVVLIIIGLLFQVSTVEALSKLHIDGRQIKDESNSIVYLRGVLRDGYTTSCVGFWQQEGGAYDSGYTTWNETAVRSHMQQLKDYDMNVMRWLMNIEWWQKDLNTSLDGRATNRHYRESVKDAIRIAQEYEIYIILDMYMVRVGSQPKGPYPPYSNTGDEEILPDRSAFVDFWRNFSQEMKDYPNVIYEVFNEPVGMPASEWFDVVQDVIEAVRSVGDDHIILAQYAYCGGFQINEFLALNDSTGNVGYANHIYRWPPGATMSPPYDPPFYEYEDMKNHLENYWNYDDAIANNITIIITECGPFIGSDWNQTQELIFYKNIFRILNEWGLHYTGNHWDNPWVAHRLQEFSGRTSPFPPNQYGQVLVDAIAASKINVTYPINTTGYLKDYSNNPVQAKITFYDLKTGKNFGASTDTNGAYSIPMEPSVYDIEYNTSGISIRLPSVNISSNITDIFLSKIGVSDKTISLTLNISKHNQVIQVYSDSKPHRIIGTGVELKEKQLLSDLSYDNWYYDSLQKKVHVLPILRSGPGLDPVPIPGTPYKWLGIGTQFFRAPTDKAGWDWLLDTLKPKVVYYQHGGDWWEKKYWYERVYDKYQQFIDATNNLLQSAHERDIYVVLVFGNGYITDIGIGTDGQLIDDVTWNNGTLPSGELWAKEIPAFMSQPAIPHENIFNFRWHVDDYLSKLNYTPLYFLLCSEFTASKYDSVDPAAPNYNYSQNKADIEAIKKISQNHKIEFGLYKVYRGFWWINPFMQDYPAMLAGNYPYQNSTDELIVNKLDDYSQGFLVKQGIIATRMYDPVNYWTPEAIRKIFDEGDDTDNVGVLAFGITNPVQMFQAAPDFVSTVTQEAEARGYITSLTEGF